MKSWSSSSLAPLAMVRLINAICSGSYVRSRMGRGSDSASASGDDIEQPPHPPSPPGMARMWATTEMLGKLIAGDLEAAPHNPVMGAQDMAIPLPLHGGSRGPRPASLPGRIAASG